MLDRAAPDRLRFWLRISGLFVGFLFLVWLPFEDVDVFYTTALAITLGAWLLLWYSRPKQFNRWGLAFTGSVAGLLVSPIALTMMAFKSSIHAHGFSDFALPQVEAVLANTPWFVLGGLLLGVLLYNFYRSA